MKTPLIVVKLVIWRIRASPQMWGKKKKKKAELGPGNPKGN